MINFSGNPAATVILTYSPTNAAPEDEVQQYYDNLCRTVESVPAHNVLIITGDFNARLGKEHVNFPFHEETNRNGEYFADFIQEKGLISANTKFQKNNSRQWTYMSPQGLKYQLDYILVRKNGRTVLQMHEHTTALLVLDQIIMLYQPAFTLALE